MKWIFQSATADLALLYFTGVLAFAITIFFPVEQPRFEFVPFIMLAVIDVGHQYVSIFRVMASRQSDSRYAALILLACVSGAGLWLGLGIPYFWYFWNYFTFYHHVRQFQGLHSWYGKLNQRRDITSERLMLILVVAPFVAFHFRIDVMEAGGLAAKNIFAFPNYSLFWFITIFWLACLGLSFLLEMKKARKLRPEWNRISALYGPALLTGLCFFFGNSYLSVVGPLLVLHGLTYMALVAMSVNRVRPNWGSAWKFAGYIGVLALLAGVLDSWATENYLDHGNSRTLPYILASIFVSAPAFWHYFLDARLWKKSHADAAQIYRA